MFTLVLVVIMMLAMSVTALAAEGSVSITINRDNSYATNAEGTRDYTYYQVFRATMTQDHSSTGGGVGEDGTPSTVTTTPEKGVSYYLDATQDSSVITKFQTTGDSAQTWFTLTQSADGSQYVVSWKEGVKNNTTNVQAAAKWIVDNNAYITTGALAASSDGTSWTANVAQGYYVIAGSEGKNLVAATTDITIKEKNSYPTIDKKEKDEDLTTYQDNSVDVAVGDVIEYQVTVHIPGDANQAMAIIDKMTEGLTYDSTTGLTVKVGETEITSYSELTTSDAEYVADADWQIKLSADTVKANQNKDVVITFKATVNDTALTDAGRKNTVTLKYNNTHYVQSDEVAYTTYFTGIEKVDGKETTKKLSGVEFTLKEGNTEFKVSKGANGYYIPDNENGSSTVVTGADGKIIIRGLDSDKTYTLTETKTNDGYNLLKDPVTLQLTEDEGDAYSATTSWTQVQNMTGSVLPSTGGIGTTIFYIVGAILVVGAGVILITRKRMTDAK